MWGKEFGKIRKTPTANPLYWLFCIVFVVFILLSFSFADHQQKYLNSSSDFSSDSSLNSSSDYSVESIELLDSLIYSLPEINKARNELNSSYYDLKATYSEFGINIDSFYRYSYNQPIVNARIGPGVIRLSNEYNYNYGLQFNWILKTFGVLENLVMSKKVIYESNLLKYNQAISDNYFKFYRLFYDVFKSYNFLEFVKNLVNYTEELLYSTKKLYDLGVIPKVDYLRVLSSYNDSKSQYKLAYENYQISVKKTSSFLYANSQNTKNTKIIEDLLNLYLVYYIDSNNTLVDLPIINENEYRVLKILYSNINAIDYQKKSVLSKNNPFISLSSNYVKQKPTSFSRDYNFNIVLSLNWKIFDSNLTKNQAMVLEEQKQSLYQQYLRTKYDLITEINNIKSKFEIDKFAYQSYVYNLDYRKETFRLIKLKYENGLATYLDYLDAQNNLLQTIMNLRNYKNEIFLDYVSYLYLNDQDIRLSKIYSKFKESKNNERQGGKDE